MTHVIAGISGGRTSALMAARYLPGGAEPTVLCFQNTGLEHPETYVFLQRLSDWLKREVVWLEWRPGPRPDAPPKSFGWARVTPETSHRGFDLMLGMLRAIKAYRAAKGEDPVTPWARQRICTAYLKHRVQEHWVRDHLQWDVYDTAVGLRADEPSRVAALRGKETQKKGYVFPLDVGGVDEPAVRAFWRAAPFDLGIESYQGNCTGCFLKDQSDLARLMEEPETNVAGWKALQEEFPGFGGFRMVPYAQLHSEAPFRRRAERQLRAGVDPKELYSSSRERLVVLQEKRRLENGTPGFSCSCETSMAGDEDEDAA